MREEISLTYGKSHPELVFWDGLDSAIVGVIEDTDFIPHVAYSITKILDVCIGQGMNEFEAREHIEYNILGQYVGRYTPQVVDDLF